MKVGVHPLANQVAKRGAKFLDHLQAGWYQKIDLNILDIANSRHCILGQLYGTYLKGLCELTHAMWESYRNRNLNDPVDGPRAINMETWHGFDLFERQGFSPVDLTQAWYWQVLERVKKDATRSTRIHLVGEE